MASPTNTVDIHDKNYATTHALMLAKHQDMTGRESTPAQQDDIAGEWWGDFHDDDFIAIRAQGLVPLRYPDATGDATPSAQKLRDIPNGGALRVRIRGWGKVAANDYVYREIVRRYERNGATVLTRTDLDTGNDYSAGGTLTTASIDLLVSGTEVQIQVTGEAATTIDWRIYADFLETHAP